MDTEKATDIRRWYAIHTKFHDEERADRNLTAWGIETFAPRIKKRSYNQFSGKPINFSAALFPRYIFARFDADKMLGKIYHTRGVKLIVSFNQTPQSIDDEVIALIKSRVGEDGFVVIGEILKPGDEVIVKDGMLKGISGIFDRSMNADGRVMILLKAIHTQVSFIVEKELVGKFNC